MHAESVERWTRDHAFGQEAERPGEKRTQIVIVMTAVMMVAEIATGIISGSMALLADGLHRASHASAVTVSALACCYTRRHARDARFSFGTDKLFLRDIGLVHVTVEARVASRTQARSPKQR